MTDVKRVVGGKKEERKSWGRVRFINLSRQHSCVKSLANRDIMQKRQELYNTASYMRI